MSLGPILPTDRRLRRAQQLTASIMQIVAKHLDPDRERDCMREVSDGLLEAFHQAGVEVITDADRAVAGLPPRNREGYTDDELRALEQRRLDLMRRPIVILDGGPLRSDGSTP